MSDDDRGYQKLALAILTEPARRGDTDFFRSDMGIFWCQVADVKAQWVIEKIQKGMEK